MMVTSNPNAQYHSMNLGARAFTPCSILSKSSSRHSEARPTTNTENPIPIGVDALVKPTRFEPVAIQPEFAQFSVEAIQRHPKIEQGSNQHIATDSAEDIKVKRFHGHIESPS